LLQGKYEEAEVTARRLVALRESILAASAPETGAQGAAQGARAFLGQALFGQKKYAAAEVLLVEGFDGLMETVRRTGWQGTRRRAQEVADVLAQLYEATNQPDKAALWKRRALGQPDTPEQAGSGQSSNR